MSEISNRIDGRQTFWNMCENFSRPKICEGLEKLGWKRHQPRGRGQIAALREALEVYVQQNRIHGAMVRALENTEESGFSVVHEGRGQKENEYTALFAARCEKYNNQTIVVVTKQAYTDVDAVEINKLFARYLEVLPRQSVAKLLTNMICDQLGGVPLRPNGGFYWLPGPSVEKYRQLIEVIEPAALGHCKIYLPKFALSDPEAVHAVRDAIKEDVAERAEAIRKQAADAGEEALKSRRKDAQNLHDRVAIYEAYLGQTLADLHGLADECEANVVESALLTFPTLFGAPMPQTATTSAEVLQ